MLGNKGIQAISDITTPTLENTFTPSKSWKNADTDNSFKNHNTVASNNMCELNTKVNAGNRKHKINKN